MVMILLIPPLLLICLLYIAFRSAQERNPPYWTLISIVLAVVIASSAVVFHAVVRTYCGKQEWRQEKRFFYRMFTEQLAASGDLKTAAGSMRMPEVRERTLRHIRQIVRGFLPRTVVCMSLGGAVLLLAAGSLWCGRIAGKKPYPYGLLIAVLIGGGLFDTGLWYWRYSSGTGDMLKNILRIQQEFVMKELAETETDLTVPEIIGIVEREAENLGFDHGQSLPGLLRKKEAGKQ